MLLGPPGFKISRDEDVVGVQRCVNIRCVQVPGCLDFRLCNAAWCTDVIDIPSPSGNSYSTAMQEISLVFSAEMIAH